MTLDDLSTYEQHEYDIYAADSYYARQYQVQCQYCRTTDSGTWEQLERVTGWHLAKRETCPKCAAKLKADPKCQCGHAKEKHNHTLRDEHGFVEAVICNDYACAKGGGCWGYEPPVTDCDGCGREGYDLNEDGLCEWCEEKADAAVMPYMGAIR